MLLKTMNETGVELVSAGRMRSFRPVDYNELLRFHAILLFTQTVKISRFDSYWKKNSPLHQRFVSKQMKFHRFKQLKRVIRCYVPSDAKETGANNPRSKNYDAMYKISPLQNTLLKSFRKHRFPMRELTIDEQMIKYKVRLCQ